MYDRRPRIIDVQRKPTKCPVCGNNVVDIIYGTGDLTDIELLLEYRIEGLVGGDNIPRRPPIWECSCGCKRFRKVNADGTDAPVKVKLLKNLRKGAASKICWSSPSIDIALSENRHKDIHRYYVDIITDMNEEERLSVSAVSIDDAEETAVEIVAKGTIGLNGHTCISVQATEREKD